MLSLFKKKKELRKSREGKIATVLAAAGIDMVLDIGGNIGQTGERLRDAGYRGAIVSFEPGPGAHSILVEKAKADPLWRVAPRMAIGAEQGDILFNISESSDMSSALPATDALIKTLPKTRVVEQILTPVRTLDSLYDEYCPAGASVFVKIDTQGFERHVLNGAQETLNKICGLQMELSLFPLYEGEETYLSFLNDLHRWGFSPAMIIETTFSRALNRQLQIDAIFMRGL